MRAVRCDACGAKAMMAAAKCPSCGHLFELRDGFGELLPLAYCSSCDSYYPEKLGECKWCGTKPEHPPITPLIWKAAGSTALVMMVGTAFVLRNRSNDDVSPVIERARQEAAAPRTPTSPGNPVEMPADTALARSIANAAENTSPSVSPAGSGSTTSAQSGEVAPTSDAPVVVPQSTAMAIPGPAAGTSFTAPTTAAKSRRSARWVSSVSRDWVIVRAGASKQSRIVASIGPNSRVQLGETQGTWRRIRAKGLVGWVEPRTSFSSRR